jgi:hypothetical protein
LIDDEPALIVRRVESAADMLISVAGQTEGSQL